MPAWSKCGPVFQSSGSAESESEKLLHLEDRLHQRLIGQKQAVSALARAIRRNRAGFGKKHKPASFIFVGPTGVGKTELVKALAEAMFESEDAMVRLDMSEFMEPHTVSKLIGSPPGYVGYDDGGQLTEKIRRKPYSVILLDEIEKAHADVFNILLQILDDGRLTDSHGRLVSFENTIIVMTSQRRHHTQGQCLRVRRRRLCRPGKPRPDGTQRDVPAGIPQPRRRDHRLPRADSREEIRQIVDLMLNEVIAQLKTKDLRFVVTDAVKDFLAEKGYDPKYGARPLRKTIQRLLEDPLSDLILSGKLANASGVSADVKDGAIQLEWL